MRFWELFWQFALFGCLVGFAILVIVVAIGGVSDIKVMLRSVERQHDDKTAPRNETH